MWWWILEKVFRVVIDTIVCIVCGAIAKKRRDGPPPRGWTSKPDGWRCVRCSGLN